MTAVLDLKKRGAEIGPDGADIAFVAPSSVFDALATAIGVTRVLACSADLHVEAADEAFDVSGVARATIVQTCVVSLDAFETAIEERFAARFAERPVDKSRPASRSGDDDDEEGLTAIADEPEPIVGGILDLGALVQEHLTLAVDPYPRKPGVVFEAPNAGDDAPSPFAKLAALKRTPSDRET